MKYLTNKLYMQKKIEKSMLQRVKEFKVNILLNIVKKKLSDS